MKLAIFFIFLIINVIHADVLDDMMKASNWYHKQRYPKECTSTFNQSMKVKERKSPDRVEVTSNQIGFSPIAFIELNYSVGKECRGRF